MIEFTDKNLFRLALDRRTKGDLQGCREFLLRVADKPPGLLAAVTYDLAKQRLANGKFREARELFANTSSSHQDPVVRSLCQERSRLINAFAETKHDAAFQMKAVIDEAQVKSPVKLQFTDFQPDIAYVGTPAAYRSGYDREKSDPLSKLIRLLKAGVDAKTVEILGRYLGAFAFHYTPLISTADLIVPVPANPGREFLRGYSIPGILAEQVSTICAIPLHEDCVRATDTGIEVRKQPRWCRPQAAKEQFVVGDKPGWIQDRRILIVDDVITTGSTVRAVAQLLLALGAKDVSAIALAHTESGIRKPFH